MSSRKVAPDPGSPVYDDTDDISFDPDYTADGIVTQDASVEYPATRSNTVVQEKASRLENWLKQTSEEREKFLRATMSPVLTMLSPNPHIANALYDCSGMNDILSEFIQVYHKQAKTLESILDNAEKKGRQLEVQSFSKMNKDVLNRIGLVQSEASAMFDAAIKEAMSGALIDAFDTYWRGNSTSSTLLICLDLVMRFAPHKVEASSRRIIDGVLMLLADVMIGMGYEYANVPELKVRSLKDSESPGVAVIDIPTTPNSSERGPTAIILRGAVDYTLISNYTGRFSLGGQSNAFTSLHDRLSANYDVSSAFGGSTSDDFRVLLIEAKRAAEGDSEEDCEDWLEKHEPQIIGEAMAGVKFEEHRRNLERNSKRPTRVEKIYLPWCLTDGIIWFFGVLVYKYGGDLATSRWYNVRLGKAKNDGGIARNNFTAPRSQDPKPAPSMVNDCELRRLTIILFLLGTSNSDELFTEICNKV